MNLIQIFILVLICVNVQTEDLKIGENAEGVDLKEQQPLSDEKIKFEENDIYPNEKVENEISQELGAQGENQADKNDDDHKEGTEEQEMNEENEEEDESQLTEEQFAEIMRALKPLFGVRQIEDSRWEQGDQLQDEANSEEKANEQQNEQDEINESGSSEIMYEWDQIMVDFEPEDLVTFEVQAGQSEVLYENISYKTIMRGAYFIPSFRRDQKIDFMIKNEKNEVMYLKEKVQEGIFKIEVPEKGEYKFIFTNKRSKEPQYVTFAIDVHNSTQEHLRLQDLNPVEMRIENIHSAMKDNYFYKKIADEKLIQNNMVLEEAVQKLFFFSIIEIIGIICITIWQVYYVKRIIGDTPII